MIEIGKSKTVVVRQRINKKFMPKLDADGNPETKIVRAEVIRCTHGVLDGQFGCDHGKKIVVRLKAGDVVEMWALGTRRRYSAEIRHVFAYLVRGAVLRRQLEKARERKAIKQAARERRRLDYAERKLRES